MKKDKIIQRTLKGDLFAMSNTQLFVVPLVDLFVQVQDCYLQLFTVVMQCNNLVLYYSTALFQQREIL